MISIELSSIEDFYNKNCWEGDIFLKILENNYPELYARTIKTLNSICQLNGDDTEYSEDELKEIFFTSEIIEIFENLYFEEDTNLEREDIILNYYVKEENHTDRGIEYLLLADGYILLEVGEDL